MVNRKACIRRRIPRESSTRPLRPARLLLCDHAGRHIPAGLGDLGVPEAERRRHIGWDIGAADVARELADLLDAPLVLCHVSRLVIDVNRRPYRPTSVP